MEVPEANAKVEQRLRPTARRRAWPTSITIPGIQARIPSTVLIHAAGVTVGTAAPAEAAVPEVPTAMVA